MSYTNKLVGGILLVSGTTIGAGMLALPVCTGLAGFFPSVVLYVLFWIYMTYTAFLMLEVNLWMENKHTNLVSMAKQTLGRGGEIVSWITYLFLLYSLTTAYIAGSAPIVIDFIYTLTGYTLPSWAGSVPMLLIFGFFVYRGTQSVDYVNRLLMFGLAVAYIALAAFLTPHVEVSNLAHADWNHLWVAVSVVATSFGYHIIIPTLTTYLHRDLSQLKKVIFIGSLVPLIVYIIWELLVLGIVPLSGLEQGLKGGTDGACLLSDYLQHPILAMIARCFSFFAIVTSFLGVSLSLSDFLADGLKIKKTHKGRAFLFVLTFLPPIVFTLTNPRAFFSALGYAGAFGVVILLGLLPALMAWSGRYRKQFTSTFQTPGGKIALIAAMGFSLAVIALEIASKF